MTKSGASRPGQRRRAGTKDRFLVECQSNGYTVRLVFVGLQSADLSRGRVMERVEAGGHDVPDDKIESRFPRTFSNLSQALRFVDATLLFDNSSSDELYRFVAEFRNAKRLRRKGFTPSWTAFLRVTNG